MNRIAAQNARDRKRSYVVDLERKLAEVEAKVCGCVCVCVCTRMCVTYPYVLMTTSKLSF